MVEGRNRGVTITMHVTKTSRSTGHKRSIELRHLRRQVMKLKQQLEILERREDQAVAFHAPTMTEIRTMVWRKLAMREHQMRLTSVAENSKLKKLQNDMRAMYAGISAYIQRKCESPHVQTQSLERTSSNCIDEVNNEFDLVDEVDLWRMIPKLDSQFSRTERVMTHLRARQEVGCSENRILRHPDLGAEVESLESVSLPFSGAFVMQVVWGLLPWMLADEHVAKNRQCCPDTIEMHHQVRVNEPSAQSVLHAVRVSRRYGPMERIVVVVSSLFRVLECESGAFKGASIAHTCWITADDIFQAVNGTASRLSVAASAAFERREMGADVPKANHPSASFLEGVIRAQTNSLIQRLESQLLSVSTAVRD